MPKPAWLSVMPESATGDASVQVSGTEHTGRVSRSYVLTLSASGVDPSTVSVEQSPDTEFVTFATDLVSVSKAGGLLVVSGTSNSSALTFSIASGGTLPLVLPASYIASGNETTNGGTITGDPGTVSGYTFTISFSVPVNTTIVSRSVILTVSDAGHTVGGVGIYHSVTITQAAGDAYIYIGELGSTTGSVTLPAIGTAQEFQVLSNTSWSIS